MIRKVANPGVRHLWLWRNRSAFTGHSPREKPQLLVDISAIFQYDARTGIQRVVRAVWSELVRRSGRDFTVVPVYATNSGGFRYAPVNFLSDKKDSSRSEPVGAGLGDKFLGLDLSAHLLPKYRRQIQTWRANGATVHLMVYDLLPLIRPEWFSRATVRHFHKWFDVLAHDGDQAICISDKVMQDVQRQMQQIRVRSELPIARVNLGGDIAGSVPSTGVPAQVSRLLERARFCPAILMVGTIEPRKGYNVALAAFEYLWQTQPTNAPDLIIVGRPGWKTAALQERIRLHPEQGRRLYWLEDVSDEALCLLYQACRGVFVAAYDEGFGLPLLEAAAHASPVLARDLPVFREHGLTNTIFFDDDRYPALAARLTDLLSAGQSAPSPQSLPTWSDCVDGLLKQLGLAANLPDEDSLLRRAS